MNGFTPLNIQNIGMKKRYTVHLDSTILPSLIILVYVWISSVYAYEKLMQITIITITPIEILLFRRGKQLPPKPFSIYSKSFSIPSTSRSFWYPLFCWAGGDLEDFDNKWRLHYMITYRTTASEPTSLSFFFFFLREFQLKFVELTAQIATHVYIHKQWRQQHIKSRILITGTRKDFAGRRRESFMWKVIVHPQKSHLLRHFWVLSYENSWAIIHWISISFVYYTVDKNMMLKCWIAKFNPTLPTLFSKQSFSFQIQSLQQLLGQTV